jgi:hypothetical protein
MLGLVDWVATSWEQVKKAQSSKVAGGCLVENGPTPDSRAACWNIPASLPPIPFSPW